jgi:hypothetical protein
MTDRNPQDHTVAGLESRLSRANQADLQPWFRFDSELLGLHPDNGLGFTSGLLENCYGVRNFAPSLFPAKLLFISPKNSLIQAAGRRCIAHHLTYQKVVGFCKLKFKFLF